MQLKRAARVILVGAPGVGKGTQSERLLKRFPQLQSVSTGDLLRSNVKNRTPLGIMAENKIKTGGLVADDLMLRLISSELRSRGWLRAQGPPDLMTLSSEATTASESPSSFSVMDTGRLQPQQPWISAEPPPPSPPQASDDPSASFILDGYPRNAAQATTLDAIVPINLAVSIKTPFSVILDRIAGRWVHEPSGRVYNTSFNAPRVPGRDDVTGDPLVQRPDDSEHIYRARFRNFMQASEPLLEHYAKKGVLLEVEGLSSDEISPKLYDEFARRFVG
ncbi:adenylate kinase domain-containing protein [Hirsutella rhossiliensis]|uniref:GTP:AMP phosphotransferase, mitochondrial n=1 Tax=Hirsutella rhossiliensis TaxID=111463 RepID=A0A9P8MRK6_9HYPO|nr:adenylate kinase domain-containing protein [Hirsutella rhossiliensis]KAH0959189.1 adenylate kinase domain-containing protein [Hirsutella rhossiliensis]